MAPGLNSVSESRRQKFFGSDSSQANLSSDTTRYITEFTSLSNELANIRREAAIASELSEPNHTDKGTTPQEREILGQYNQADGANRLNEVLQVAQARNFWNAMEDGVRNDLTRVANNLGIDPTSQPPSQGSVRDLAPDNHVQDVQSGNETENGTSTLVANQYPASKNDNTIALDDKGTIPDKGSDDPSTITEFSRQNSGSESEPYRPGIDEENKDKNEIISDGRRDPDLDQYTIKREEKEKLGVNDRSQ